MTEINTIKHLGLSQGVILYINLQIMYNFFSWNLLIFQSCFQFWMQFLVLIRKFVNLLH